MARNQVNILLCSAGRRVELIQAFKRAYRALDLDGGIIALDADPLAPALQAAHKPYVVPRLDHPDFIPTLLEICRTERVHQVFPLIDPDIPILSCNKGALQAAGAKVAVIEPAALLPATDKWHTSRFFTNLGLNTPRSWLPETLPGDHLPFPLFIKPRRGSAAKGTFKISDRSQLDFFLSYVTDPIIQEYLPGPEVTNDVICDLDGRLLAVVSRQRIEVRWGEVAKGVTVYDPVITAACAKIARSLPARGPITVQCLYKDGQPFFTEINARMGGGLPLGITAGAESTHWLLAIAAGIETAIPPLGEYQTGLYLTRFDQAFFLDEAQRQQLAKRLD